MSDFFDNIENVEVQQEDTVELFETSYVFCISSMDSDLCRTGALRNDETYRKFVEYRINNVKYFDSDLKFRVLTDDPEFSYFDKMKLTVRISGEFGSVRDIMTFLKAFDIIFPYGDRYQFMNNTLSLRYTNKYKRVLWFFTYKSRRPQFLTNVMLPVVAMLHTNMSSFLQIVCEQALKRKVVYHEICYYSDITWKLKSVVSEYKQFMQRQQVTLLDLNTIAYENVNSVLLEENDEILRMFVRNPSIPEKNMIDLMCGKYCEDDLVISFGIKDFLQPEFLNKYNKMNDDWKNIIHGADGTGYYKTHTIYNEQTWKNRQKRYEEVDECADMGVYSDIMDVLLENAHMFKHRRKISPPVYSYDEMSEQKKISCEDISYAFRFSPRGNGKIFISTVLREIFIEMTNQILLVSLALYGTREKVENLILKLLAQS